MAAGYHILEANRGATLFRTFRITKGGKPVDLTGYLAKVVVRYVDHKPRLMVNARTTGYDDQPAGPGDIAIEAPTTGVITLEVAPEITDTWEFSRGDWWLDLKKGDLVTRLVAGPLIVSDP